MTRYGLTNGNLAAIPPHEGGFIMRPIEQIIADAERELQEQAELARIRCAKILDLPLDNAGKLPLP